MRFVRGDRVMVTGIIDDPDPPRVGDRGTVVSVMNADTEFEQMNVKWDSGRGLMLIPQDYAKVMHTGKEPAR